MKRKLKILVKLSGIIIFQFFVTAGIAQSNQLDVLNPNYRDDVVWMKYTDLPHSLYGYIAGLAMDCLEDKQEEMSSLKSKTDWSKYLKGQNEILWEPLKKFKKTPLNARVTSTIEKGDFIVEKVVFESQPGFYVTGSLFMPKVGTKPFPAILYSTGHSQNAFRRDVYQINILNLVKKGFAVFSYDPIGQGERSQYLNQPAGNMFIKGTTHEHSFSGGQCLLSGYSVNDYFLWDGIRALDYMCNRPDIDPERIGMTGRSGGGQQTAMLSAIDSRIYAAAPECYVTSYKRLFESIGPQDAEQNLYYGLKQGIDHIDLVNLRVPKPTMLVTTTQDFFSIQGARETYAEAKKIFELFGKKENLLKAEANGPHTTIKKNRESMYRFFRANLNLPGECLDEPIDYFTDKELQVSPTGQVTTSYSSKTVFDLNKAWVEKIINSRRVQKAADIEISKDLILEKAYQLSGLDTTRKIESVVFTGKIEKSEYKIEKYFIQSNDFDYPIPFVFIKPFTDEKRPILVYFASEGKGELLKNESEILKYLEKGYSVLAADVIGTGELKNTSPRGDAFIKGISYNLWVGANLVAKSIAGIQASDMYMVFNALKKRIDVDLENITAIVKNEICSSYLHFALFNQKTNKTILISPVTSYEDIALTKYYEPKYLWTAVPGAIQFYDLPILESLIPTRELIITTPVKADGNSVGESELSKYFSILKSFFKTKNKAHNLKIFTNAFSDKELENNL